MACEPWLGRGGEDEQLNVHDLLDESIGMIQKIYELKEIKVERDFHEEELYIIGSESRFQQVLINLLSNAKDALRSVENGKILIRTKKLGRDQLMIEVRDNGSGIRKENLDKIFDSFFTTKSHCGGTGLGLGIVHSIVEEEMKGKISVESEVGKGTCFRLEFSLSKERALASGSNSPTEVKGIGDMRILLVEDEADLGEMIQANLQDLAGSVCLCTNGEEALERLNKETYDLVISDVQMPGMSGVELLNRIRKRYGEKMCLVLMTGGDVDEQQGLAADGVLLKPFSIQDLVELVASFRNSEEIALSA